jgi:hypothetical protein
MLVVALRGKNVAHRDSNFVAACVASIDARVGSIDTGIIEVVIRHTVCLLDELIIFIVCHFLLLMKVTLNRHFSKCSTELI